MAQETMSQEVTRTGILDTVKERVDVPAMIEKVRSSKDIIFEVALYLGIGFLSGFLLKKYNTYVVVAILVLIGVGTLHHIQMINVAVNWDKVSSVLGIHVAQPMSADNIFSSLWEFLKTNKVISISGLVGFVIGLKVG